MAINPPSDIVLDVARAADPEKYRAAVERLARLRETASDIEAFVPGATPPAAGPANAANASMTGLRAPDIGAGPQLRRPLDAYSRFEAFVLQTFVQSMLPKDAESVFGRGTAGEFWKSLLAEKVGDEIARSGHVGIARRLAAGPSHAVQPLATDTTSPPATPLASTPAPPLTTPAETPEVEAGVNGVVPLSERS